MSLHGSVTVNSQLRDQVKFPIVPTTIASHADVFRGARLFQEKVNVPAVGSDE